MLLICKCARIMHIKRSKSAQFYSLWMRPIIDSCYRRFSKIVKNNVYLSLTAFSHYYFHVYILCHKVCKQLRP